uniref:Uncharacterized protein n=1 Tax=Onchocerca volvulus TaxID=6282 RepID=A0A8R1XYU1_ONCVO
MDGMHLCKCVILRNEKFMVLESALILLILTMIIVMTRTGMIILILVVMRLRIPTYTIKKSKVFKNPNLIAKYTVTVSPLLFDIFCLLKNKCLLSIKSDNLFCQYSPVDDQYECHVTQVMYLIINHLLHKLALNNISQLGSNFEAKKNLFSYPVVKKTNNEQFRVSYFKQ